MTRPRLTSRQVAELLREWVEGVPIATLAARYGCDQSYPAHLARRRGLQGKRKKQPKLEPRP